MICKKILCATDGSHSSAKAVQFAVDMAKELNRPLTFVTVTAVSTDTTSRTHFWDQEILDAASVQVGWDLHDAKTSAEQAGLRDVQYVTCAARNISKGIVSYAEGHGYDHIVIGHAGRGALGRALLGSVARDIVNHAHCPITIVC